KHHFPNNSGGNVYGVVRDIDPSEFNYRGELDNSYRNTYFKHSNTSEDNWGDIRGMLAVRGTNGPGRFGRGSRSVLTDPEQWLRHIAFMAITCNSESGINSGHNDDYYLYRGIADPRFIL